MIPLVYDQINHWGKDDWKRVLNQVLEPISQCERLEGS